MEGLVNYSSEDEQDECGAQNAAERDGSASSSGGDASSNSRRPAGNDNGARYGPDGGDGNGGSTRNPTTTTSSGSSSYKIEDAYNRHKGAANRSSSSYYGRDGRDVRDSKYTKDNRYDHKMNDRNRTKDYKTDYKRERERESYHDNRRPPRDDMDRGRHSSSSMYSSNYHRYSAGGSNARGDERPPRYSGGNDSYSSSSAAPHRHHAYQSAPHQHQHPYQQQPYHNRSYDERIHEPRPNRPGGERHRRRGDSRSPSPTAAAPPHHYNKRPARTDLKSHHSRHRSRSKSRSPASRTPTPTQERAAPQPLMQARISALEMERQMQQINDPSLEEHKSSSSNESATAASMRASEALLALPLSETAPKQPNVIAVAPAATASHSEPAVIQLPSYYNPSVINPNKYAEQVQKRKLLWGAKKAEDTAAKWGNAQFSQDSDGKVASKFMRLMGIKNAAAAPKNEEENGAAKAPVGAAPDVKSREMMFSNMEQQYEVARQVTHTMRGVGLGFSSQSRPF